MRQHTIGKMRYKNIARRFKNRSLMLWIRILYESMYPITSKGCRYEPFTNLVTTNNGTTNNGVDMLDPPEIPQF